MKTLNLKSLWNNFKANCSKAKANCSKAIDKVYDWIITPHIFAIIVATLFVENIAMLLYFIFA